MRASWRNIATLVKVEGRFLKRETLSGPLGGVELGCGPE